MPKSHLLLIGLLASAFFWLGCAGCGALPGLLRPAPTPAPALPDSAQNETGLVPGLTTRLEVEARFGAPDSRDMVAGYPDQGWSYSRVTLTDLAGRELRAYLTVFFADDTVQEIVLRDITPTMTAGEVVAQYGAPAYVELPKPGDETPGAPNLTWSALAYPARGVVFELTCFSSPSQGCPGVRRDDPVSTKFYFAPKPAAEWYQRMSQYGWMTVEPWTGFANEPTP